MNYRIGHGIDVHQFAKNRELWLGGVKLSDEDGLLGHSDADVLTHAVMDALLGALAMGDIGEHFPDNDPKYLGANSKELLVSLWNKIKKDGWVLENLDCTILAQKPKISPYKNAIRESLADAFGVEIERISVKATTTEKLGFVGRTEGIQAEAVVLLRKIDL